MSFGKHIKLHRTRQKMTQEELASRLSVSAQAVSKWERDECLPDTALLPAIADVLAVSLDRLFERTHADLDDVACTIEHYFADLTEAERYQSTQQIAHLCERAIFGEPVPEELRRAPLSSYCSSSTETESGFTLGSHRPELPFFGIFPEPADGWSAALTPDERYRECFEILSDAQTLETVFALYRKPRGFTFDETYAAEEFGLENPSPTLERIRRLKILHAEQTTIDGKETRLWVFAPRCTWLALFSVLNEHVYHHSRFEFQATRRQTPYLKSSPKNPFK